MDGADFVFLFPISFKKLFFPKFEQLSSSCSLSAGVYGSSTVSRATFMKTYLILFKLAVFILEDALSVWTNLRKHSLFVGLYVSSIKTGTRHIIHLDELSSVVRLERCTKEGSSSTPIMRLVLVFTLETNNQTSNECLPKFVQMDYAPSSIKTAIVYIP